MYEEAAKERASDARALADAGRHHGAVYLQGYAVECLLKTVLHRRGVRVPRSGAAGHDLVALLEQGQLRLQDFGASDRRYFLESWRVSMRYDVVLATQVPIADLHEAGVQVTSYLVKLLKRAEARTNRRKAG